MQYPFQLKREDCSILGQVIFKHLEKHQISMRELARRSDVTQPGLRAACLKRGNPTKSTLHKLSPVISIPLSELNWMVRKNHLRNVYEIDLVNVLLICIEDILRSLQVMVEKIPEQSRLPLDKLVDLAFDSAEAIMLPQSKNICH